MTYFLAVDSWTVYWNLIFWGQLSFRETRGGVLALSTLWVWLLLVLSVLQWWHLATPRYAKHRNEMLALYRGFLLPVTSAVFFPTLFPDTITGPGSFVRWVLQATALFHSVLATILIPLPSKHTIPIALVHVGLKTVVNAPNACRTAVKTDEGVEFVKWAWSGTARVMWGILNAIYQTNVQERTDPHPFKACCHMLTWCYLMLLGVVVCYVLWALEYQSRVRFLRREAQDSQRGSAARREQEAWAPLKCVAYHLFLVAMFSAIAWEGTMGGYFPRDARCLVSSGDPEGACPGQGQAVSVGWGLEE